jgi:hypothetical protein
MPIQIGHTSYRGTVMVGIASAAQDTIDIESLLEHARTAMGSA